NTGTLTWDTGCGYWGFYGGGRFTNATGGTWTITGTGTGTNGITDFGGPGTNAVVNAGTTTVTLATTGTTVTFGVTTTNSGTLTVTRGTASLPIVTNLVTGTLTGGTWNAVTGSITLPDTVTTNAATVAIGASGQVTAASTGTAAFIPLAVNSGSFSSGRSLTLTSSGLTNSGTLAVTGGSLVTASLTQSGGTTTVTAGATLNAGTAQVRINGGTLTGSGTVRGAVSGAGTVAPDTGGTGTLTVTGTVNTTAGTTLAVTEAATTGTRVSASGAVNAGALKLAVTTTGVPAIGDVRTVLSGSSRTGTVASVTGVDVPAAGGYWVVGYTATAVTLTLTAYPAVSVAGGAVVTERSSGTTPATFTVTLASASPVQAVVDYATTAGTATSGVDYAGQTGTVTFLPGETTKTVQVSVVGDTLHENDETFGLVLSNPRGSSLGTSTATATIDDDDAPPAFSVNDAEGATSAAGGGTVTFTVSLDVPSGLPASVQYATVNGTAVAGTDYTATSGTLTLPAGQTTATVNVQLATVSTYAPPKSFTLVLSNPVEATVADGSGTGTVVNGNPNGPTVAGVVPGSGAQGTTVPVTISGTGYAAGATVAVTGGSGVTVNGVTVVDPTTITASFVVSGSAAAGPRSVTITVSGQSNTCTGCFAVVARPTVTGTDRPNLAVGATDVIMNLSGTQFQPGADVKLVRGSTVVAATSTTVSSTTSATALVTLASSTPTGAWNVVVVNPDGGKGTCTNCVTVWPAPKITSITPATLARGTTSTVTISGSKFVAGLVVSIPGAQLSDVTVVDATTITVTVRVPATATTGSRTVKVFNPASVGGGTGSLKGISFT
ncbi:Calx-beta domain-containing protein, partial [Jatrophihabitans sp. YIM 134969]